MVDISNPMVSAAVVLVILVINKAVDKTIDRFFKKTVDADYLPRDDFKKACDACKEKKTHDDDELKQDKKDLHEKINCMDRKVAKLVGAFEARGWITKEKI